MAATFKETTKDGTVFEQLTIVAYLSGNDSQGWALDISFSFKLEPIFGSVVFHGYTRLFLDRELQIAICGDPAEMAAWLRRMADQIEPRSVAQVTR